MENKSITMKVLILAGGFGTRLAKKPKTFIKEQMKLYIFFTIKNKI